MIYKTIGLDYYMVGFDDVHKAALFFVLNGIGVTENDLEEFDGDVDDIPEDSTVIYRNSIYDVAE